MYLPNGMKVRPSLFILSVGGIRYNKHLIRIHGGSGSLWGEWDTLFSTGE